MAWSKYQIFLALMMVVTGSINTIATKFADKAKAVGRDKSLGERPFNHPFVQAVGMFMGELFCLFAFKLMFSLYKRKRAIDPNAECATGIKGSQNFSPFIFLAPAMCDLLGTSIMYVGLNLTYASSFQMLRGSVIVFTGLLSVAFLNRVLKKYEWFGILFIIAGLLVVGVSDIVFSSSDESIKGINSLITGDLLIVLGQIITATQMVIEEKFVSSKDVPPLQAVGWEGLFGFVTLLLLLVPMNYIPTGNRFFDNPNSCMEDPIDALHQIANSWQVQLGVIGTVVSIAFFNFAGISVTKELSATTRMVLDSVRTLVIWLFSMAVQWQKFSYLQLIGFLVLMVGMCLYNDVFIRPFLIKKGWINPDAPVDQIQPIMNDEEPIAEEEPVPQEQPGFDRNSINNPDVEAAR